MTGGAALRTSRLHYAWVVAGVTFVVLLITAGVRATPGLFMVPLEQEFGWSRAVIPAAVAVNIALFGNTGVVYGWIGASHQLGASLAALGAGAIRTEFGDYRPAFLMAGLLCLLTGASFLAVGRRALRTHAVHPEPG